MKASLLRLEFRAGQVATTNEHRLDLWHDRADAYDDNVEFLEVSEGLGDCAGVGYGSISRYSMATSELRSEPVSGLWIEYVCPFEVEPDRHFVTNP